jgi:D-serine deaminase-like pyridoxal phosphate-dependent protein
MGREGNPEKGYGGVAGTRAVLAKLNEYHGFVALPDGGPRPSVGTVVPVVPNHVCPVVASFEELLVTDTEGATMRRWAVAARGRLS